MLVWTYHSMLHNIPEQHRPYVHVNSSFVSLFHHSIGTDITNSIFESPETYILPLTGISVASFHLTQSYLQLTDLHLILSVSIPLCLY
jgi:hypothetical protein